MAGPRLTSLRGIIRPLIDGLNSVLMFPIKKLHTRQQLQFNQVNFMLLVKILSRVSLVVSIAT